MSPSYAWTEDFPGAGRAGGGLMHHLRLRGPGCAPHLRREGEGRRAGGGRRFAEMRSLSP